MIKLQTVIFALLLQQTAGALRLSERKLSEGKFLSYEPATTVTDHAAIDLDQALMEAQLALGTDQGKDAALEVYKNGAFSKSYAEITLDTPLQVPIPKGVTVFGKTADGSEVRGTTADNFLANDPIIEIQYHAGTDQATWTNCHVGGNPDPNVEGCFAPTGELEIGDFGTFTYTYTPLENNHNGRTLQGFSREAQAKMYECGPRCPYNTYEKFYHYYGEFDYANQWVLAAFNRGQTNFANGNAHFDKYGMEGITEAIKKGTAYMSVWMYVIREMEDAIDDCTNDCATADCNDDQVHAWDEAVAFYTGSVPKSSGEGGHLLYTLAQKRCENFGTCRETGKEVGMAIVNSEIFKNFRMGKQDLIMGNCKAVEKYVKRITELMAVPLIQGTLRYAYVMDKENNDKEKAESEGATFAAAVLPLLYHCSKDDADIVFNNMRVGNGGNADFEVVKTAFESNYDCLGITCQDVGGLVDSVKEGYLPGAQPCGQPSNTETSSSSSETSSSSSSSATPSSSGSSNNSGSSTTSSSTSSSSSSSSGTSSSATTTTSSTTTAAKQESTNNDDGANVGLAVGLTIGIVALLIIVALLVSRKGNEKEFDGAADPEMT